MSDLWRLSFPYWEFMLRGAIVYIAIIILLRLGGKRQIGQLGAGEFVAILLISNAVQNSMNGGDNSVTGGLILAAVIIALSILVDYFSYKSKRFENIVQGTPTLLVHNGEIQQRNLEHELMNTRELRTILRRQGVHDIGDVAAAILESNGSVSVIKKSELAHNKRNDSGSA